MLWAELLNSFALPTLRRVFLSLNQRHLRRLDNLCHPQALATQTVAAQVLLAPSLLWKLLSEARLNTAMACSYDLIGQEVIYPSKMKAIA